VDDEVCRRQGEEEEKLWLLKGLAQVPLDLIDELGSLPSSRPSQHYPT